ncbi:MAG: alpha/beta hydrolase [Candidatus Obscuribacterales bacterium]|nr:alpha/beta hydrolase [Candidatus Obscuribacterales bacterium]
MNRSLRNSIVLGALVAAIFSFGSSLEASGKAKKEGTVSESEAHKSEEKLLIPILYLTDRDQDTKDNFGSKRRYIIDCKHDMYYGTANVAIKDDEHKANPKLEEQLQWRSEKKLEVDSVSCDKINPEDPDAAKKEFFQRLETALSASAGDRLCLFVHGACEGFNDAALDAASMAYALEYPLVLYSWPSVPKTFSYEVDSGNNEWSQAHFNMFIKDLLEFRKEHKLHLVIVSHSMGNRLVIRSAALLAGTQLVKDAELVSPDIDAETFKHYVLGMENQGATLRLYSSTKDKMLALSQMVAGGYYRLGEGVGTAFNGMKFDQKKSDSQIVQSDTDSGTTVSGSLLPAHKRGLAERIDFTAVDEGFRGHSIPFQVLASMIRNDNPGKGLSLISSTPGKGSALSHFMSWSHKLGKIDDQGDRDLCKKIVKVSDDKKSLEASSQN